VRILVLHNRYQQAGGEDSAVAEEIAMLKRHEHAVDYLGFDNESIRGVKGQALAAARAFYSFRSARAVAARIDAFRPDIVHVHNFLATMSPSVFFVAQQKHVPIVLTLHNYRLLCSNALLFRDGHPCEECVTRHSFLPGVRHACYRSSRLGSAVVGGSIALHSILGTWRNRVDRYIALSEFEAAKIAGSRIPSDRIRVKPNFVSSSLEGTGGGGFALFAGRLSPEKGLQTLIEADAENLLPMPVHIAGDGPMRAALQHASSRKESRLHLLGVKPRGELQALMRKATVLVVPSIWHETFGMVCVEAFAAGLPILASSIGGLPEIVEDGVNGHLFPPGDATALAGALGLFEDGSDEMQNMRRAARRKFETHYSEERNYRMQMQIYEELVHRG
jgi:glycosyltransferase involved in cell wall biosynthesis